MKRALCLLVLILTVLTDMQAQDFTSRFMASHPNDSLLQCLTISPKMMERIMKLSAMENGKRANTEQVLSKLKSARIITSKAGKEYFNEAETLLLKNQHRFTLLNQSRQDGTHSIFVRKRDSIISELILLSLDDKQKLFTIIDFTGEMDKDFIKTLTQQWDAGNQ
ncbi:MAG: DUF4252 domain-containing protein [Clostridium sp.]|nr:DUF4252 domain-containing protein [Clostridium sp.]